MISIPMFGALCIGTGVFLLGYVLGYLKKCPMDHCSTKGCFWTEAKLGQLTDAIRAKLPYDKLEELVAGVDFESDFQLHIEGDCATLRHWSMRVFAESFANVLYKDGGENYFVMEFESTKGPGNVEVIVRHKGRPCNMCKELKEQLDDELNLARVDAHKIDELYKRLDNISR